MRLTSLCVHNHRNLQDVKIELSDAINALQGDNGAGKTSVLEAIDVLVRGRSFRTSVTSNLLSKGASELRINSSILDENKVSRTFGIQKGLDSNQLWVDGEKVSKQSALSHHLPIILIHPNVNELIAGGPVERRTYMDWGLFHVEPGFADLYRNYNRLLAQRNAAFKQRKADIIKATSIPLAQYGTRYNSLREAYFSEVSELYPHFKQLLAIDTETSLIYNRGWPDSKSLETQLEQEAVQWTTTRHTQYGPHRADLTVSWNSHYLASEASRGQQKLLALCLKLTQAYHLMSRAHKTPVLLIDELPAELDRKRIPLVMNAIKEIGSQVLITCVSREQIQAHCESPIKWFHVEHGTIAEMI